MVTTVTTEVPAVLQAKRRFERPRAGKPKLMAALTSLERLPALRHAQLRLIALLDDAETRPAEIVLAIESDAALAIAVLRAAAQAEPDGRSRATDVQAAVEDLGADELRAVVTDLPAYDFFDRSNTLAAAAEKLRGHGLAVQRATIAICGLRDVEATSALTVGALLHDVGKIALSYAYDNYAEFLDQPGEPTERVREEFEVFGIDHAVLGATCLRRMGLSADLLEAVADHHSPDAGKDAATIRLADMLVHHEAGCAITPRDLVKLAAQLGLRAPHVRDLLAPGPSGATNGRGRAEPCTMSPRQLQILRLLRAGKVYKEIASDLGVTVSTIRTHTHAIYSKLQVLDRTQAVLTASDRGWI